MVRVNAMNSVCKRGNEFHQINIQTQCEAGATLGLFKGACFLKLLFKFIFYEIKLLFLNWKHYFN